MSCSTTLACLDNDLSTMSIDIQSDKAVTRQKSFKQFDFYLNTRAEEIFSLLSGKSNNKWKNLFECIFAGTVKQLNNCKSVEPDNKSIECILVIQKFLGLANKNCENVEASLILNCFFKIFENQVFLRRDGFQFLKILRTNVLENQIINKNNVTIKDFKRIIDCCMDLYSTNKFPRLMIVQCIVHSINIALQYSLLCSILHEYLPQVKEFISSTEKGNVQNEWIIVAYLICFNIAVEYRYTVCVFVEDIAKYLHKAYSSQIDEQTKDVIFKFEHLSIILHAPKLELVTKSSLKYVVNQDEWYKSLRNCFCDLSTEMKTISKQKFVGSTVPKMNEGLLELAKRLCVMVFWDENVWTENNFNKQAKKKAKHCNGLQNIIDLVEEKENCFSWAWMVVLSEIILEYPVYIDATNYQTLLQLLAKFQPTIQHHVEIKALYKCYSAMLYAAQSRTLDSEIQTNFCKGLWKKIFDCTIRSCTSSSNFQKENHCIMQLLIKYKKCPSDEFISSLISDFVYESIQKTNVSLTTIIEIIKTYNIESLKENDAIIKKILDYVHQKPKSLNLKTIIMHKHEKLETKIVAQLTIMCVLAKKDVTSIRDTNDTCKPFLNCQVAWTYDSCYINAMKEIEHLILLKCSNVFTTETNKQKDKSTVDLELPNELKCVIDEDLFEYLRIIMDKPSSCPEDLNNGEIMRNIDLYLFNVDLCIHLLNELISFASLTEEKFQKCFLTKYIQLYLQQLEVLFKLIKIEILSKNDIYDLLQKLNIIFNTELNQRLAAVLRSNSMNEIISWIEDQIEKNCPQNDKTSDIEFTDFEKLSISSKIRCISLKLLANYIIFGSGINTTTCLTRIIETDYRYKSNCDIYCVINLMKIIGSSESPTNELADWMLTNIMELCKYHKNQSISTQLLKLFSDVLKFMCVNPECTNNIAIALKSFARQCSKESYSVTFTLLVLDQVKILCQYYPNHFNNRIFQDIYFCLAIFLHSPVFSIVIKTIEICGIVTHFTYSNVNQMPVDKVAFQRLFFSKLTVKRLLIDGETSDKVENLHSAFLHLLSTMIKSNYSMRDEMLFALVEFCWLKSVNIDKIKAIMLSITNYINCSIPEFMALHLQNLLVLWIGKEYQLSNFPWYITTSTSFNEFVAINSDVIIMATIRKTPHQLQEMAEKKNTNVKYLLEPSIADILTYLLPLIADNGKMNKEYVIESKSVYNVLVEHNIDIKQQFSERIRDIIIKLFENLIDRKKMKILMNIDFNLTKDNYQIDHDTLLHCLAYIQKFLYSNSPAVSTYSLIEYLCLTAPKQIESIILSFKTKFCFAKILEEKLKVLFQFSAFIESLLKYLKVTDETENTSCKNFIIRDICYFFCYKISTTEETDKKLGLAFCFFFKSFLQQILPVCAKEFQAILNHVTSTLSPLCINKCSSVSKPSFDILTFLIIEHKNELENSIAALDDFFDDVLFEEIRKIHKSCKYKENEFTLKDEIEHFLQNDRRKLEGLTTLRSSLSTKKTELIELYQNMSSKSFAINYSQSALHRLLSALIQHILNKDNQCSLEAAKCLGEIGPVNLHTIVMMERLKPLNNPTALTAKVALENLCILALEKLNNLLVHPDILVMKTASDAVVFLSGITFMHNFVKKTVYLEPYVTSNSYSKPLQLCTRKTGLNTTFNGAKFASYPEWTKIMCREMFLYFSDTHLHHVAILQLSFAEDMTPLLVEALLCCQNPEINYDFEVIVTSFFKEHMEIHDNTNSPKNSIFSDKMIIKAMLKIVECIRIYDQRDPIKKFNLNYLYIAKGALFCKAFFKSILYCELWVINNEINGNNVMAQSNEMLQDIMTEAYLAIGVNDAVSAIVSPLQSRQQYLQLQCSWDRILLEYDAVCEFRKILDEPDITTKLKNSGLYCTAYSIDKRDDDYECAWRLGDWNLLQSDQCFADNLTKQFEKQHYFGLKCLYNKDERGIATSLISARKTVVDSLRDESLECTNTLYKHLLMLQQLQQIEDFVDVQLHTHSDSNLNILNKWNLQDRLDVHFQFKEALLSQRITIFNASDKRAQRTWVPEAIQENLMKLIVSSRNENCNHIAIRNIAIMRAMELPPEKMALLKLEDAKLNLELGENVLSKSLLLSVIDDQNLKSTLIRAEALRLYGSLLADTQAKDMAHIENRYFKIANDIFLCHVKRLNSVETKKHIVIFDTIAKYADRSYIQINNYVKSDKYKQQLNFIIKNQEAIEALDKKYNTTTTTKDERKQLIILKKTVENDKTEIEQTQQERSYFLEHATLFYVRNATENDDSTHVTIFRLISLWLSNASDENILKKIEQFFNTVPAHKLIDILPQIGARLGDNNKKISKFVAIALEKCARYHPHHTLPHLMALANAHADDPDYKGSDNDIRVICANRLLDTLKKDKNLRKIIVEFEILNNALVQFANNFHVKHNKFSISEPISKIKQLKHIYCSTITVPVIKNGVYDSVIGVLRYDNRWELCGGINAPKKVYCRGLDGNLRIQLLKGKDDLRQDAVMQQVFVIMNSLFKQNKSTNEQKLQVRTYKIVPLAQRTGVLEWCLNTIPIGTYLIGIDKIPGAHERYRPKDLTPKECKDIMIKCTNQNAKIKLDEYLKILQKIKPVFHYFFLERFTNPGSWFERQQAYRKSVATNSMIGYILGIGDRHVNNILIDENTAELIHIDFGIAFESGKILPHPELIPFRLSRDIIAAMGMSGVEGVFRKSCEKTLEVLRQNQDTILTILEVLLYDPLYAWILTTEKAFKCQEIDVSHVSLGTFQGERNTMADRSLARLREKLNGKTDGHEMNYSSVEGQVDNLIAQATNPIFLSKIFYGWQPYL